MIIKEYPVALVKIRKCRHTCKNIFLEFSEKLQQGTGIPKIAIFNLDESFETLDDTGDNAGKVKTIECEVGSAELCDMEDCPLEKLKSKLKLTETLV